VTQDWLREKMALRLQEDGFEVEQAHTLAAAWKAARALKNKDGFYDVVIIAESSNNGQGLELASQFKDIWKPREVLMITDKVELPEELRISLAEATTPVLTERVTALVE
jgi:DNA-binding response OmpR family regulator